MAVVGDPAHLAPLLATTTDAFRWGHPFNVLGFIVGSGSMIVSDGDDHRRRRGATQPGFARRRLDAWIPVIVAETDRVIDESLLPAAGPVDFYPHGRALVRRIVVRVLFGDSLGDRADELGAILEPAMTYGVQPALRQLPHPLPHTRRAEARAALRAADRIIYEEIDRRRRARQLGPIGPTCSTRSSRPKATRSRQVRSATRRSRSLPRATTRRLRASRGLCRARRNHRRSGPGYVRKPTGCSPASSTPRPSGASPIPTRSYASHSACTLRACSAPARPCATLPSAGSRSGATR